MRPPIHTSCPRRASFHLNGMRTAIASVAGAAAVLAAASMLGVAAAEAPTTTPSRSVSVQGVGGAPVDQAANASQANAAYRQAMASAIADGHEKAEFLAGKAGATLGLVQSIVENGGYVQCSGGEEGQYGEYRGEQPDFGASTRPTPGILGAAKAVTRPSGVRRRRSRHGGAKAAAAVSCSVRAEVTLAYALP
jgi:Protein of unknown function (DUF541)